jgi:alcohol dehydrogenase
MKCRYYIPTLNLVGRGCVQEIGEVARDLGAARALVVASAGSVGEEQAARIGGILSGAGISFDVFPKVQPDPTLSIVSEGLALFRSQAYDLLAAVGGGSAIDATKGIGLLAAGGRISLEEVQPPTRSLPPLFAIATTAGTGSEVTKFAVLTDDETHRKITVEDWRLTPAVSVNDPELMVTLPPAMTAATSADALTHSIEAIASVDATPITDAKALAAVELIARSLPRAVADGSDLEARENLAYASFLAGTAFNNAGLGLVHAMSHPLGSAFRLPHGLCNALLLPAVTAYNQIAAPEKYARIAMALGSGHDWRSARDNAEALPRALAQFLRSVGIEPGLRSRGVPREALEALAEAAVAEPIGATNPRSFNVREVRDLYLQAW